MTRLCAVASSDGIKSWSRLAHKSQIAPRRLRIAFLALGTANICVVYSNSYSMIVWLSGTARLSSPPFFYYNILYHRHVYGTMLWASFLYICLSKTLLSLTYCIIYVGNAYNIPVSVNICRKKPCYIYANLSLLKLYPRKGVTCFSVLYRLYKLMNILLRRFTWFKL